MLAGVTEETPHGPLPFSVEIRLDRFVVHIDTDDRRIMQAIRGSIEHDLLQSGKSVESGDRLIRLGLRLSRRPIDPKFDVPPSVQATSSFENLELHDSVRGRLLVVDRKSVVVVDPAKGNADGYVSPEHIESSWIIAHRIFYLTVIELLRCHLAYYIHAGCVCDGEKGILICGASGGGKSTLTYALARSGFSYLSDDGVFLRRDTGGLEMFSFPEKIKLDSRSRSFFGELNHLSGRSGKHEIALKDTRIRRFSVSARPVALIFPVRSRGPKSEIRPVPRHEALVRVLGQSIPLLTRIDFQRQLEVLTELVETCGCFELSAAPDFDDIPELIASASRVRA